MSDVTAQPNTYVDVLSLKLIGAVEFGSRPLGVAKNNSDYDLAVHKPQFDIYVKDKDARFNLGTLDDYFDIVPPSGTNYMLLHTPTEASRYVDILVFEHKKDVDIVRKAVAAIASTPKYILQNRQRRIDLYQQALLDLGWRHQTYKERIKYLPTRIIRWIHANFKNSLHTSETP